MTERSASESWAEYRRLVLAALERHEDEIETLKKEKGEIQNRLYQAERLSAALRNVVFGDGTERNMQTRMALIEKFVEGHPSLSHEEPSGEKKVDKKMLVLLIGSIGGLVGVLKMALEVILKMAGG